MKNILLRLLSIVISTVALVSVAYAGSYPVAYCPAANTLTENSVGIVTAPGGWTSASVITSTTAPVPNKTSPSFNFLGAVIGEGPSQLSGSLSAASCSYGDGTRHEVNLYNTKYNHAYVEGNNWYSDDNGYSCSDINTMYAGTYNCSFTYAN